MSSRTPNFNLTKDTTSDNIQQTIVDIGNDMTTIDSELQNRKNETTTNASNLTTHKASGDHDTRYYTQTQIDSPTRDHKGTWQGLTPVQSDVGLAATVQSNSNQIGNLSNLSTTDKSSLVNAISEVKNESNTNQTNITTNTNNITTISKDVQGRAINVLYPPAPLVAAVGDGVHDDTTAIQGAINLGGLVILPSTSANKYKISQTLINPTGKSLNIIGMGSMIDPNNADDAPFNPNTQLVWSGNASPMIQITGIVGSCNIRGISLVGSSTATYGLVLDTIQFSNFEDISIQDCTTAGLWLNTNTGATQHPSDSNVNTMFNSFKKIATQRCPRGIVLDGNSTNGSNSCHNTFEQVKTDFSGTAGVHYVKSDNNTFTELYTYKISGSGYGVQIEATAGVEYIYHFQGIANGVSGNAGLVIFGYDRSNGQTEPVGSNISWTENGMGSLKWFLTKPIEQPTIDGATSILGRTMALTFNTSTAIPNGTDTLIPAGANTGITNFPMPFDAYVVGVSVSLSTFMTAGQITLNIKDNGTVIYTKTMAYPTGNNQFFTFTQGTSVGNKISNGHGLTVELVGNASLSPTTIQGSVTIIFAI